MLLVDIPELYQLGKIEHSPPVINGSNGIDYSNPIAIFMALFEEGIERLHISTNVKNRALVQTRMDNASTDLLYSPWTIKDIKSFIGCILLMDISRRPELAQYWGLAGSKIKLNKYPT